MTRFHVEITMGVFGKLVARCLAVLAFLRATDVLLFTTRTVSGVTLANVEGSLRTSKKGEASMESSVVTHLARWSSLLRVLSYRSMEVLADARWCFRARMTWMGCVVGLAGWPLLTF